MGLGRDPGILQPGRLPTAGVDLVWGPNYVFSGELLVSEALEQVGQTLSVNRAVFPNLFILKPFYHVTLV